MSAIPLRILILEDRLADAELMVEALRQAGYDPEWQRVDTESDYLANLAVDIEVILADYSLPQWDALKALQLLQDHGLDIPMIVVTGTLGDELAAECVKRGAADYVIKDRMARLGQAVTHALEQKKLREDKRQAETTLRESEEQYRAVVNNANDGIAITVGTEQVFVNKAFLALHGLTDEAEVIGRPIDDFVLTEDLHLVKERTLARQRGETVPDVYEFRVRRNDGIVRTVQTSAVAITYKGQPASLAILRDITELKHVENQLQQSVQDFRRSLEGTVGALTYTLEIRDPYTAGHLRRVAQLASAIASELGLPNEQVEGIRITGLLHDIGKIGVPAEILSKPGRISEIEMNLIKCHPQVCHDILKTIDFPWPVAQVVIQHHERMDGSGYPAGLSGDDLVMNTKILSVADVVEAMASYRPYRPALGINKALLEIMQQRGVHFDGSVVDACVKLFTEQGFKLEEA